MNSINLIGRLTRDAELRHTSSEKAVASFTIAVDRGRDAADFIPCVAWEKTAQFVDQYFHKGDLIALSGRLQSRTYTDSSDKKRTVIEVVADRVFFAGSKKATDVATSTFEELEEDDGELPF